MAMYNAENNGLAVIFAPLDGRLVFSKSCLNALGFPGYVQMLVNRAERRMALRAADKYNKDVFKTDVESDGRFVIEGKPILSRFVEMMNWKNDGIYEVHGDLVDNEILLFDLNRAERK